jgi:hypothetical protein
MIPTDMMRFLEPAMQALDDDSGMKMSRGCPKEFK